MTARDFIGLVLFAIIVLAIIVLIIRSWVHEARARRKNEHPQDDRNRNK